MLFSEIARSLPLYVHRISYSFEHYLAAQSAYRCEELVFWLLDTQTRVMGAYAKYMYAVVMSHDRDISEYETELVTEILLAAIWGLAAASLFADIRARRQA